MTSADRDGMVKDNGSIQSDRFRFNQEAEVDSSDRLLPRFPEPEPEAPGYCLNQIVELRAENSQLRRMFTELSLKYDTLKSTKNAQVQARGEV